MISKSNLSGLVRSIPFLALLVLGASTSACSKSDASQPGHGLTGTLTLTGSSTLQLEVKLCLML